MKEYALDVELRTETGKNATHRLRNSGFIPGVIYAPGTSDKIKIPRKAITTMFHGHISESVLIDIKIAGKTEDSELKVFVKDYQADPVTNEIMHMDFYKTTAGQKIRTMVGIEITGSPAGVRMGGILEIMERELEIECVPAAMPEKIVVDVSELQIGDAIHVSDLNIAEEIKLLSPEERVIATVLAPHIAKEEELDEAAEGEEEGETREEGAEGEGAEKSEE